MQTGWIIRIDKAEVEDLPSLGAGERLGDDQL
jgi:hypothetical protein